MGEFWDTHDFTEYDNPDVPDAEFTVSCAVPVALNVLEAVERHARHQGLKPETLINRWIQEKLAEETHTT